MSRHLATLQSNFHNYYFNQNNHITPNNHSNVFRFLGQSYFCANVVFFFSFLHRLQKLSSIGVVWLRKHSNVGNWPISLNYIKYFFCVRLLLIYWKFGNKMRFCTVLFDHYLIQFVCVFLSLDTKGKTTAISNSELDLNGYSFGGGHNYPYIIIRMTNDRGLKVKTQTPILVPCGDGKSQYFTTILNRFEIKLKFRFFHRLHDVLPKFGGCLVWLQIGTWKNGTWKKESTFGDMHEIR